MVTFVRGDIFSSPAQVLTNTVNCVGLMGKGVALEFKMRYPKMFNDYKIKCDQGDVKAGQPYLWEDDSVQVLNFPTKRHWKDGSLLQDIEDGLKYLTENYEQMGLQSLAMPALGCGLGGLEWSEVQPLIVKHLGAIPDLDVYVYEPHGAATIRSNLEGKESGVPADEGKISARPPEL